MKLGLLFLTLLAAVSIAEAKPNIIFILADDLGCYGQKPGLQRHYAGSTVCAPSRCVLMTGLHSGHSRVRGDDPWSMPDGDVTVPNLLQKAGFRMSEMITESYREP